MVLTGVKNGTSQGWDQVPNLNGELAITGRGVYTDEKAIPQPPAGDSLIVLEDPDQELLSGTLAVSDDGQGGFVISLAPDTRPFCQLIMGRDDGSGGFASAWDQDLKAFVFDTGETVLVQGILALDQAMTQLIPVDVSFRTPIVRNTAEDLVVKLTFSGGLASRSLSIASSGIYRITAENAYKVRLLNAAGELTDEVKIIVSE